MDLTEYSNQDLNEYLQKRAGDLLVMSLNLSTNRITIPKAANEFYPEEAMEKRSQDLVEIAEELTRRKQEIHLNLGELHPIISEILHSKIQESELLAKKKLMGPPKRLEHKRPR